MTQTPPNLSRLIQGYLDHTGIEACPYHQMDHGVRDPDCDHCKRVECAPIKLGSSCHQLSEHTCPNKV